MSNLKHRNPHNTDIRDNYQNLTKKSKALLRTKQQCHFNDKLNLLSKLQDQTRKVFGIPSKLWKKTTIQKSTTQFPLINFMTILVLFTPTQKTKPTDAINFNIGTTYEPTTSDPLNKLDDPISEIEIISTTKKLKTKKAPGLDRIHNEMLKCGIHYLAFSLSILFNTILKSGYLPASWSKGMITAIYKSGDKSDPSNYLGICVSSCLCKLFCSILNQRLHNFIYKNATCYVLPTLNFSQDFALMIISFHYVPLLIRM